MASRKEFRWLPGRKLSGFQEGGRVASRKEVSWIPGKRLGDFQEGS